MAASAGQTCLGVSANYLGQILLNEGHGGRVLKPPSVQESSFKNADSTLVGVAQWIER